MVDAICGALQSSEGRHSGARKDHEEQIESGNMQSERMDERRSRQLLRDLLALPWDVCSGSHKTTAGRLVPFRTMKGQEASYAGRLLSFTHAPG